MKTEKELQQKREEIHTMWLNYATLRDSKLKKHEIDFELECLMQKCNLCYVFLHALEFCGVSSKFETELTPYTHNEAWTEILRLPPQQTHTT